MLEELAKKDKLWREIAFRITNNHDDADELVQEMYLRIPKYKKDIKTITTGFVKVALVHMYIDSKKQPNYKREHCEDFEQIGRYSKLVTEQPKSGYSDRELTIINKISKLSSEDKNLLELSYAHSLRDIEKITGINYVKVSRDLDWIKIRILGSKQKR